MEIWLSITVGEGAGEGEENVIILDIDITNLLVNKHSLNNIARDAVKGEVLNMAGRGNE